MGQYGVQKLEQKPAIAYLKEKSLILLAFNRAKDRLNDLLELVKDFEIYKVEDIDISGVEIKNEEMI